MAILFEGECIGQPVNVEVGGDRGKPRVRWDMKVTEGQHAGKVAKYSGKLDRENIKWTKRDMRTIGWKGDDVSTFVSDVEKANATGRKVPFTAEIAEFERPDGSTSRWTSAKLGGALPLSPLSREEVAEVNDWFRETEDMGAPPSESAGAAGDDIPF